MEYPCNTDFLKTCVENASSTKSKDFSVREIESFPPGCNPFHHDAYHMGKSIGEDCVIMHSYLDKDHRSQVRYLIIVDIVTGRRLRVELPYLGGE